MRAGRREERVGFLPGRGRGQEEKLVLNFIGVRARVLSCFSRVRLCATLWSVARQALLSVGFSRQESWSGLLCPSPNFIRKASQFEK